MTWLVILVGRHRLTDHDFPQLASIFPENEGTIFNEGVHLPILIPLWGWKAVSATTVFKGTGALSDFAALLFMQEGSFVNKTSLGPQAKPFLWTPMVGGWVGWGNSTQAITRYISPAHLCCRFLQGTGAGLQIRP